MIQYLPVTGSTNADLAGRLAGGERVAEGDWLVADRQSAGRGRLGREWADGLGNFMGSSLVHLGSGDPHPGSLALVAGMAVHEAVSQRLSPPVRPRLKWPNDLLIGEGKLAGILLEKVGEAVIVGIGVNLASAPRLANRATASLADFGPAPDRDAFAAELAALFAQELARWRSAGLAPLTARWQAAAHPLGTALRVMLGGEGEIAGHFAGLDESGALRLSLGDGTTRVIHAGEVEFA